MDVKKQLKQLGVKPVEGQNFLTSEHIISALVEAGEVDDKKVLEIGAGTGSITEKLIEKASKVYAVERDTVLANHLKEEFNEIEVLNQDILEIDFPNVERCVSNIPFQISSEIIEMLGKKQIQSVLILQKELADKAVMDPGNSDYGRFSVMVNYYFLPVKLQDVGSRNYYPQPDVDTSIIKLYPNKDRHGVENEDQFFEMVKALFTHKMKKTRNAFVDSRHILDITKDEAKELRDEIPHSEERVVNLDVRKINEITEFFYNKHD